MKKSDQKDLFDEIEEIVPPQHLDNYWRLVARLRNLDPYDEILLVVWGLFLCAGIDLLWWMRIILVRVPALPNFGNHIFLRSTEASTGAFATLVMGTRQVSVRAEHRLQIHATTRLQSSGP